MKKVLVRTLLGLSAATLLCGCSCSAEDAVAIANNWSASASSYTKATVTTKDSDGNQSTNNLDFSSNLSSVGLAALVASSQAIVNGAAKIEGASFDKSGTALSVKYTEKSDDGESNYVYKFDSNGLPTYSKVTVKDSSSTSWSETSYKWSK